MVAVILSAQDSDANINKIAPAFFSEFPNLEVLSTATIEDLFPYEIAINKSFACKHQ
jgi:endonuclease III